MFNLQMVQSYSRSNVSTFRFSVYIRGDLGHAPSLPLEFRVGRRAPEEAELFLLIAHQFYRLNIQPEPEVNATPITAHHKVVHNNKHNYAYVLRHLFPICELGND